MEREVLAGGVGNAGSVVRVGDEVHRPEGPHHVAVHALLAHVRAAGFTQVPEVLGRLPGGRERLAFIPGDVAVTPFPPWSQSDELLASMVDLLRRYHDATVGFVAPPGATWSDEMTEPGLDLERDDLVIAHHDVCPENVVCRDGRAIALLDFEFAGPGRRVFDLAALASMCVPVDTDEDAARTGRVGLDPFARLRVVAEAYGLDADGRVDLVDTLAQRFERGGQFVLRRIAAGEAAFAEMWEQLGGQGRIDRRRDWFDRERPRFLAALDPDRPADAR